LRRPVTLKIRKRELRRMDASTTCWPQQPCTAVPGELPRFHTNYIDFYFNYGLEVQNLYNLGPPVFDLTSEGELVDGWVCVYAREVGEDRKDGGVFDNVGFIEDAIQEQGAKQPHSGCSDPVALFDRTRI
jgi:hypothetical protein